jgi:hypothetical protein
MPGGAPVNKSLFWKWYTVKQISRLWTIIRRGYIFCQLLTMMFQWRLDGSLLKQVFGKTEVTSFLSYFYTYLGMSGGIEVDEKLEGLGATGRSIRICLRHNLRCAYPWD